MFIHSFFNVIFRSVALTNKLWAILDFFLNTDQPFSVLHYTNVQNFFSVTNHLKLSKVIVSKMKVLKD